MYKKQPPSFLAKENNNNQRAPIYLIRNRNIIHKKDFIYLII
jgi:hypothetical protein